MALPLLSTLPATARIALPTIIAGTRRGLSGRAIERIVRNTIGPISRPRSIVPLMRRIKEIEQFGVVIREIPKHLFMPTTRLPLAMTPIRTRFSFTVAIQGTDPFGNLIDRHVTVGINATTITPNMIEDDARFLVSEEGQSDTLINVTVEIDSGIQRAEDIL